MRLVLPVFITVLLQPFLCISILCVWHPQNLLAHYITSYKLITDLPLLLFPCHGLLCSIFVFLHVSLVFTSPEILLRLRCPTCYITSPLAQFNSFRLFSAYGNVDQMNDLCSILCCVTVICFLSYFRLCE